MKHSFTVTAITPEALKHERGRKKSQMEKQRFALLLPGCDRLIAVQALRRNRILVPRSGALNLR
jgi:hypothetical protein